MSFTPEVLDSLDAIQADIDRLTQQAQAEANPSMAQQYQEQAEYARQKGKQIYQAGRTLSGPEKLRTLAQGATFGAADEIEAGLRTGFGFAGDYDATRDDIRAQNQQTRDQFPQDALGLEVAGSLPWGAVAPGAAWAGRASSTPGVMARGATLAGAEGGLYGYGKSDAQSLPGQAVDTALGAAQGVGLYGGLVGATSLAPELIRGVKDVLSKSPTQRADDVIGALMKETGLSADDVRNTLAALGPDARLADISTEFQKLLLATRQRSPAAGGIIDDTIGARQAQATNRLVGDISETTGVSPNVNAEISNLKTMRKMFDEPTYKGALKQEIELDENLLGILRSPAMRKDANRVLRLESQNVDDLEIGSPMTVEVLDKIKKGVDERIRQALPDNAGKLITEGQLPEASYLRRGQGGLVAGVDEQVPLYNQAREQHAYFSKQLEPMEEGRRYGAMTDDYHRYEIMQQYKDMPAQWQQRFRQGVVGDLLYRVRNSGGGRGTGFAGSASGAPASRLSRFQGASGGDASKVHKLGDIYDREGVFYDTYAMTNPNIGSKTSAAESAVETADEAAGLLSTAARAGVGDMTAILDKLRSIRGLSKPVATQIAQRIALDEVTPQYLNRLAADGQVPLEVFDILKNNVKRVSQAQPVAISATQATLED